jgi:hypothetical protein
MDWPRCNPSDHSIFPGSFEPLLSYSACIFSKQILALYHTSGLHRETRDECSQLVGICVLLLRVSWEHTETAVEQQNLQDCASHIHVTWAKVDMHNSAFPV